MDGRQGDVIVQSQISFLPQLTHVHAGVPLWAENREAISLIVLRYVDVAYPHIYPAFIQFKRQGILALYLYFLFMTTPHLK